MFDSNMKLCCLFHSFSVSYELINVNVCVQFTSAAYTAHFVKRQKYELYILYCQLSPLSIDARVAFVFKFFFLLSYIKLISKNEEKSTTRS